MLLLALSDPSAPTRHVKVGLVPRASDAVAEVHGLSFGLIADRAARVDGLQLTLVYAQLDEARGVQFGLLFNFVAGTVVGAQLAAGANFTKAVAGVQLALGFNVAERFRGLQIANANSADDARGLQLGIYNFASQIDGAQIGFINGSDELRGLSIGLVNQAQTLSGLQLAPVNIAGEARGLQVGLVNLAARAQGESVALLSLVGDGIHELALYASDTMWANFAVKLGARHLYTALTVAYDPGDDLAAGARRFQRGSRRFGLGGGLGWRLPIDHGRLESLEIEATALTLHATLADGWGDPLWVSSLRAGLVVRLLPRLALVVGPGVNVTIAPAGQDADVGLGVLETMHRSGDTAVRIYPGFVIGGQI
jgi:hypothetical protein